MAQRSHLAQVAGIMLLIGLHTTASAGEAEFFSSEAPPFRFVTDHPIQWSAGVRDQLLALNTRLEAELGLPMISSSGEDRGSVTVFVFASASGYREAVLRALPQLRNRDVARDAIFLMRQGKPYIFMRTSHDMMRSLRHEFVHAINNAAIPNTPVWLDEGLAQYYEVQEATGWQPALADQLIRLGNLGWRPNLGRLEKMSSMCDLSQRDYAEAWSWIYLLMQTEPGREVLAGYLAELRQNRAAPGNLSDYIHAHLGDPQRLWYAQFRGQTPTRVFFRRPRVFAP